MKHSLLRRRFHQLPLIRNHLPRRRPIGMEVTGDNLRLSPPNKDALPDSVLRCLVAAHAPNTRRAYADDVAAFERSGRSIPCTDLEVAGFLAEQAPRCSPATLRRRVAGIGFAHRQRGLHDPTRSRLVADVLRGLRRLHGRPQRQSEPVSPDELDAALVDVHGTRGLRDRALLLLGFASGLRRSELVALDVEDITWSPAGLLLQVRRSKNDQALVGRQLAVAFRAGRTCAVSAVREWVEVASITRGPLFRPVDGTGRVQDRRLAAASVAVIIKQHATALGHSPSALSGHSLRAGFATSAARAGVPLHDIQQQTGHRSPAMVDRYIRTADMFAGTRRLWSGGRESEPAIGQGQSEEGILQSAAAILLRRLERLGTLSNPSAAEQFLRTRLAGEDNEVFYVMYLDTRHAILAAEAAFNGSIDQAEVHPRVIAKRALELNAAALICAHNHPSGNAEPSAADRAVTARLKQALALVDVHLLDHFVVTAASCTSLAARGWV